MAKAEGGQDVTAMTDGQMFEELIKIHAQSAGEAISSILRADIEIGAPRLQEMTIKDVEYGILEPAIFVKSCLTSQVAGNIVLVLRQRDMQVFLNELMGVDDLPDPDFVFDDVAMSAAGELMNQMSHASASSMAEYLGDTMDLSDCQLVLSDGSQDLALVIGEPKDAKVMVVSYTMKAIMNDEVMERLIDTLMELQARRAACEKARQEEEEAQKRALIMEQNSVIGQDRPSGTGGGQSPADAGTQKSAYSGAVRGTTASGGRFMGMPGSMLQNQSMNGNLSLIMDVPLNVSVEIGKTRRRLKDVLNFSNGTVVELDKQSDAPVDIIVNGQLIARGEVVVIDDNFGVRISEIVNTRSIIGNGE